MFCLYVLEYFFHDFLFWFHNETKIGSIERLGEPVIRVKYVSITIQKRTVVNCIFKINTLLIMGRGGGGIRRFRINTGKGWQEKGFGVNEFTSFFHFLFRTVCYYLDNPCKTNFSNFMPYCNNTITATS